MVWCYKCGCTGEGVSRSEVIMGGFLFDKYVCHCCDAVFYVRREY